MIAVSLSRREGVLDNPNRLRIYEAIREEAGVRAGTLQKRLGLNYGTALGHLRVLERARLVEGAGEGQRRYFLPGVEKRKVVAVSAPAARRIQAHVQVHGEAPLASIAKALRISLSTASATVSRLERDGVLAKRRTVDGRVIASGPRPREQTF